MFYAEYRSGGRIDLVDMNGTEGTVAVTCVGKLWMQRGDDILPLGTLFESCSFFIRFVSISFALYVFATLVHLAL